MRSSFVVVAALLLWLGTANAGGRKRVVVLDFEGPKAEKFHEDLVKLVGKKHTVVSVDKWNEKAEELGADKITEKNVKKIAKKLKVDGVVTGKIEKRREEYIIRLKLRSGTTGEILGNSVQTKAEGPRLDAQAQRDIKDELLVAIDDLESNHASGDEEDEGDSGSSAFKKRKGSEATDEESDDGGSHKSGFSRKGKNSDEEADEEEDPKAAKKRKAEEEKKKKADEEEAKRLAKEEEEKAKKEEAQRKKDEEKKKKDDAKKKKADDEEAALTTKKDKGDDEEGDSEKSSKRKKSSDEDEEDGGSRSKKRKASADEDEDGVEGSSDEGGESGEGRDLSVAGRAMDAVLGMSFTARTLKFVYAADLGKVPPGYKQSVPVAGAMLDLTAYPMSFSKGSKGIIRNIGIELLYDQVLVINSQKRYADAMGVQKVANLGTAENRWAFGPVLRYPVGKLVVGGALTYGKQKFTIDQLMPPEAGMNVPTDIPSVEYTMITPKAFVKYPATPKIILNADLQFHAITNTGQIQNSGPTGYGAATVTGFEVEGGGDYMVTKNIFARLTVRYETIGFKFKGDPTSQTNIRDSDPDQDVSGAKDTYFGGSVVAGYVY